MATAACNPGNTQSDSLQNIIQNEFMGINGVRGGGNGRLPSILCVARAGSTFGARCLFKSIKPSIPLVREHLTNSKPTVACDFTKVLPLIFFCNSRAARSELD